LFIMLPVVAQQVVIAQELSDSELAGKILFLQRCSVCHMPAPRQQALPELPTYGPKLEGFVHDSVTEKQARNAIENGTPRMPGFKYGLTAEDMDNIVTYLRIFKISDFLRPGEEVDGGPDKIISLDETLNKVEAPDD
jgi:mono/diheme cytochrome c family protein